MQYANILLKNLKILRFFLISQVFLAIFEFSKAPFKTFSSYSFPRVKKFGIEKFHETKKIETNSFIPTSQTKKYTPKIFDKILTMPAKLGYLEKKNPPKSFLICWTTKKKTYTPPLLPGWNFVFVIFILYRQKIYLLLKLLKQILAWGHNIHLNHIFLFISSYLSKILSNKIKFILFLAPNPNCTQCIVSSKTNCLFLIPKYFLSIALLNKHFNMVLIFFFNRKILVISGLFYCNMFFSINANR